MYKITVMAQYSPAIVTVPANMLSVEIHQFPDNGTSVVTNREYTITVSAISQGRSFPSDPVVISKLKLVYVYKIAFNINNTEALHLFIPIYVIRKN